MKSLIVAAGLSILSSSVLSEAALDHRELPLPFVDVKAVIYFFSYCMPFLFVSTHIISR